MLNKKKTRRAMIAVLLAGAMAAASFTQASAQPLSTADDASSPVVNGAASIQPQWTYRESPEVGSKQPITAEPVVDRPDTTPCTVELFNSRKFVPRDGAPPQDYDYTPPADCSGPWSKVVLESDFWTDPEAALYDKTAQLFLNGVTLYYGTTMGPGRYCENYPEWTVPTDALPTCPEEPPLTPRWHEENDVTEYSALFAKPQSGKVHLDNDAYITSYYLPAETILDAGQYWTARLVFYPVAEGEAAPLVAHDVRSLDPDTDEGEVIWNDSQSLSYTFTDLPRNLERVYLDVQREGQRGDEFYSGSGTKVREFVVKVDGVPAGVAPAYPYIYTYGNGIGYQNRNWAPVPAVSAFNFIAYRVDLTPFAGVLSDGNPHTVSINGYGLPNNPPTRTPVFGSCSNAIALGAGGCTPLPGPGYVLTGGAFWYVMGNLVLYTDSGAETTGGKVVVNTLTAEPNVVTTGSGQSARSVVNHDHTISGYVNTSHGRVYTTLDQKIKLDTNVDGLSTANNRANQSTEYVLTTTVDDGDDTSSTTVNLNYILKDGTFRDDGRMAMGWTYSAQTKFNGKPTGWVKISDLYTTERGSTEATQQYVAFDSSGKCYDRTLGSHFASNFNYITGVFDGVACDALVAPAVELSGSQAGAEVVLSAVLGAEGVTGSVEFFDGDDSLGTAVVVDGVASLTTSALAVGEHSLTARYSPDLAAGGTFVSSDSDAVSFEVVSMGVTATADPRVLAGKVYLSVSATNNGSVPVSVVISSPYGGKTFTNVAPGATVNVSLNSRLASVAAGEATVEVAATVGGHAATDTTTASYGAFPVAP